MSVNATLIDTTGMSNQQWLERRKSIIGASDVAGILGVSPWASPFKVWADKSGLLPPSESTDVMTAGKWLELSIGPWFEDLTGLFVGGMQTLALHPTDELAGATLDAFVYESPQREIPIGLGEWKTDDPLGKEWEEIPVHYQTQCQWQMYVTGTDHVWMAVLRGRQPLQILELERDQDDIDFLIEKVHAFHAKYIATGEPPATDGHPSTLDALGGMFPDHEEGKKVDISDHAKAVEKLRKAKALMKKIETVKNAAQAEIELAIGDAEIALLGDKKAFTFRTSEVTKLDIKVFKASDPDTFNKYSETTKQRTLRDSVRSSKKGN